MKTFKNVELITVRYWLGVVCVGLFTSQGAVAATVTQACMAQPFF